MIIAAFIVSIAIEETIAQEEPLSFHNVYCGPDCVYLLSRWFGEGASYESILSGMDVSEQGVSMAGLADAIRVHVRTEVHAHRLEYDELVQNFDRFAVARTSSLDSDTGELAHWIVVLSVSSQEVLVASPPIGFAHLSRDEFMRYWTGECLLPVSSDDVVAFSYTKAFLLISGVLLICSSALFGLRSINHTTGGKDCPVPRE